MKPILFNTEMVRAILDGRKTQTRRINKDGGECSMPDMSLFDAETRTYGVHHYQAPGYDFRNKIACVEAPVPICPGDILYVRETWREDFEYAGPFDSALYFHKASNPNYTGPWRPSIHMPKDAARIFLRVTDVRVERLQHITRDGAISEGCNAAIPVLEFQEVWDTTIKPADRDRYGWDANPWVWVYTFKRCGKEGESWNI